MKKVKRLLADFVLAVCLVVACLTGCDTRGDHLHIGEWICDEDTHSYQYTCGCFVGLPNVIYGSHVDNDGDRSCDVCGYVIEGLILPTVTNQVAEETFADVCEKYNLIFNHTHYVIESDEAFLAFLSDIGQPYEEMGKPPFEGSVIFCYARVISGSWGFFRMEYSYYSTRNKIIGKTTYQFDSDVNFPDVVLGYCIDFVEVPKDVFEALQNNVA